jgi:molecular chaperone GrpE (heat shock protein)
MTKSRSAHKQHNSSPVSSPKPVEASTDLTEFDKVLTQTIPATLSGYDHPSLETIGDHHIQQLLQRMQAMEATQTALAAQLVRLEAQVRQDTRATVVEVNALRTDLLGERKALSALGVFNGVVPRLDSLYAMRTALEGEPESSIYRQVDALIDSLTMMLRGLGFVDFTVAVGEPFDPVRMECSGYAQGQIGVVLEVTRMGYRVQTGVVRPVGVLIADPSAYFSS